MERGASRIAARLGVLVVLAVGVVAPVSPAAPGGGSAALERREATLAARESAVLAHLSAIEGRLAAAQAELSALRARKLVLAAERRDVRRHAGIARESFVAAQAHLVERLRMLYVESDPDPLAVVLGARSLREVMAVLDGLEDAAESDRELVTRTRTARLRLRAAARTLALKARALRRTELAAAARARTLAAARSERAAYLERVRGERRLASARLAELERRARAQAQAQVRAQAQAPAAPAVAASPVAAGGTLTVVASGYALRGPTATGAAPGWGTVAVDPSVIPLGTTMTIPGYGTGVAADVGSAVRGAAIDLWFPSEAEALAWGRRVVTIRLGLRSASASQ